MFKKVVERVKATLSRDAKDFKKDEKAQGMFIGIIMMAGGLIALVAIFSIAPLIGHSIDAAIDVPTGSDWNTTENPTIPQGIDLWKDNAPLLALVVTVTILVMVIGAIMSFGAIGGRRR